MPLGHFWKCIFHPNCHVAEKISGLYIKHIRRCEIFSAPRIWAKYTFPEAPIGESLLTLAAQGFGADAFNAAKGLLVEHPDDPDIWELALMTLRSTGIRIGQDDEILKEFTSTQIDAALWLVLCEQTASCQFQKSAFLQSQCIVGGICSESIQSYIAEYVLPPSEFSALGTASARLSSLLSSRRWDLLGFSSANQPKQPRPSKLPKQP